MKIGLISDTHGDIYAFKKAFEVLKDYDLIMHSGDLFYHGLFNPVKESYNPLELSKIISQIKKPIIFSKGNCDSEVDQLAVDFNVLDPVRIFYFKENIIYLHHGHKKRDEELLDLSKKFKFNIVVSGHTHISVSYTHLRAHETDSYLVCRLLLEKKKKKQNLKQINKYNKK